ncbi:MAG TPA: TIGR01459 family HAD-type hydrolase [Sphingomicrobium sp.]
MSFLDALPERYRLILCDVWGVVHDGYALYSGAAARLRQWRRESRFVLLITNAPRTTEAIEAHLGRIGLPGDCWDAIASSGEAGIEALHLLGSAVGFVGTAGDRMILEGRKVAIADDEEFSDLACVGFEENRPDLSDYRADLELWAARGVRMHCLNPDRVVIHGGVPIPCAGAIADAYEALSGEVVWYGKPYKPIYEHALHLAGNPPPDAVLAVGDSFRTDMLGAARMGFDAVFVTGGIHHDDPVPEGFARQHGLGGWQPVAVVDSLR